MRLGLALSGGGSHGAWQAGALRALVDAGLDFRRTWGFSAGALSAVAYFAGVIEELEGIWNKLEDHNIMRLSPRHWPSSICTDAALRGYLARWVDETKLRSSARGSLHVVSLRREDREPVTASFEPGGAWEGSLSEHIVASCAIPFVFPSVRIGGGTHIDGGVPGKRWLDMAPLADCDEVIAVSVVRPDEPTGPSLNPVRHFSRKSKGIIRRQMMTAAATLGPVRVRWLVPSRPFHQSFIRFDPDFCRAAYRQGIKDGEAFLAA
jgi:predicted acylesterase/phospholipase RssA